VTEAGSPWPETSQTRKVKSSPLSLALLKSLDVDQLRARWKILYETQAPTRFSRDLLMRAVAYRMQERVLGGLRPATRRLFKPGAGDGPMAAQPLASEAYAKAASGD
jgi:hypothetical protein